jgi:hypothetical protein
MERQMSNPSCDNVSKQPTKPRKKNALAHGVYGKDILLPWESMKDFKKLLVDLRDEFRPEGRMENEMFLILPTPVGKNTEYTKCTLLRLTAILLYPD